MLHEIFRSVRAIFFDLDNTLISRDQSFREILPLWFARTLPNLPETEYEIHIERIMLHDKSGFSNRGNFGSWIRSFYKITDLTEQEILAGFSESIAGNINRNDLVIDLLHAIKREYVIGVISNGSSKTQRSKLHNAGLYNVFDEDKIYIEGETGFGKPNPSMFAIPIRDHQIPPDQILFIGDHPVDDVYGASLAGLKTCWVRRGQPSSDLVVNPNLIIETVDDLCQQIRVCA
jgi:putative hydrolase of the HAD superfamily